MDLHFKKWGEGGPNLIILHGLLGSSDNWTTLSRRWSEDFTVYALDLRNHGASPHATEMDYRVMAEDVHTFLNKEGLRNSVILGHSMGGKVAMVNALLYPEDSMKLIIADIAPDEYDGGHEYILRAMNDMPLDSFERRSEADDWLRSRIPSPAIRQFILKNLDREGDSYSWKVNLPSIMANYPKLMGFPDIRVTFDEPVLFLKGELSDYIHDLKFRNYREIFLQAELRVIHGAGHWLHAEKPDEFYQAVKDFMPLQ